MSTRDDPLRNVVECTPRQGLPNVLTKIDTGEMVTVAYLGGSITAAPGGACSRESGCRRPTRKRVLRRST